MIDSQSDCRGAEAPKAGSLWMAHSILAAACVLVVGVYEYMVLAGESWSPNPSDAPYNLLVQGFRAGQLSLRKQLPPDFAHLADPYDPTANQFYRIGPDHLHDLSFYNGRLYLYFGVTPALILFWPFTALTGHYLTERQAALIFGGIGFLASVGLLRALWRRYFPGVSVWVVAACALALGLASGVPILLARCDVYEVSIICGYAMTMLTLAAIWCALHESRTRCGWLAAASLAYGLAVGARASLLFGAVILLVPVTQAWRERRKIWTPLLAATVPMALIGIGLMFYNFLRFDSPFEFGNRYQLAGARQLAQQFFSPRYLWFNIRAYFLEPARWSVHFPFVHDVPATAVPAGHEQPDQTFAVLTNVPLVWLVLAAPVAWRSRSVEARCILRGLLAALVMLFGLGALTLGLCCYSVGRYEVDFLPALVMPAVIGILSLERALASPPGGRPIRQRFARCGWAVLLGFSVAFNLLASVQVYANERYAFGSALVLSGPAPEAIHVLEEVVRLKPDYAPAHNNLGVALIRMGRLTEAIGHYEQALRINPDYLAAHNNLAAALMALGRAQEAIGHYEQALRINPDFAEAHCNLGLALEKLGRTPEAIQQYQQALRLQPDFAQAQTNLARARALQ
jgi:Flp pilus assembly protein TadD